MRRDSPLSVSTYRHCPFRYSRQTSAPAESGSRSSMSTGSSSGSSSGMNSTVVDIRIVLQTALVSHASGIILSHNHPSGSTVASTPDNNLTSQLKKGCEAIGIQLLDHIILTEDTYLSYTDEGML